MISKDEYKDKFPYDVEVSRIYNPGRIAWADNNCGHRHVDWINEWCERDSQLYSFRVEETAILFALKWAGT